jgi:hypothetical protein
VRGDGTGGAFGVYGSRRCDVPFDWFVGYCAGVSWMVWGRVRMEDGYGGECECHV